MPDWSAEQYLKFEDERTRPACDLLAQIRNDRPRQIVDLGCGPGNSTALLAARWPDAAISGIDTSADMLRQARERLPGRVFTEINISHWAPPAGTDVMFANAVFQWVPNHIKHLARLVKALPEGGTLAVQMPDTMGEPSHLAMRQTAEAGPWRDHLAGALEKRTALSTPGAYYDALRPLCAHFDIWHTVYNHSLSDAAAIVEWVKGTGLRPFLELLEAPQRKQFLADYSRRIMELYPPQADGCVLLRFPRLFIVASR